MKLRRMIPFVIYMAVWVYALLVFWFFSSPSDGMGFSLIFLWLLIPAATFLASWLMGRNESWGWKKWLFTIGFGLMYMLAEYATFSAANMISFHKIKQPEWIMIPIGTCISLAGMAAGSVMRRRRSRREEE